MEDKELIKQIKQMFAEIADPESLKGNNENFQSLIRDVVSEAKEEAIKQIMLIVDHMKLVCKNTSKIIYLVRYAKAKNATAYPFRGLPWAWCYQYSEEMKQHILHFLVEGNPTGHTAVIKGE